MRLEESLLREFLQSLYPSAGFEERLAQELRRGSLVLNQTATRPETPHPNWMIGVAAGAVAAATGFVLLRQYRREAA